MDRLTSLTVFGRVVECGGFSAAARHLNMSVTMVSNHVQSLEDRIGARLLNRTTRKVSLTEIGRVYYERSTQILADLDEADRIAGALPATPRGTLRLHSSADLARFLAPILSDYISAYSAVSIDLTAGERMVDVLEDGYDLVIQTIPLAEAGLVIRQLGLWRHVLCCAPAYLERHAPPTQLSDLANHNCLQFSFYPFGEDWRFDGKDDKHASIRVRGNFVTGNAETLRLLTMAGNGICLAPSFVVADDLATGALVPLLAECRPIEFEINAIYPPRHHQSTKVRSLVDLLTERFAIHREWMGRGRVS